MRTAALVGLMVLSLIAWQKEPIPKYEGDDNPSHDGQPSFCVNHSKGRHAQNCSCRYMNRDEESCTDDSSTGRCKVFCRKSACRCANPCAT